uniref:Uncharacterized protein n=1 Tax=Anguilla anguilla TaxID=7936 RepID=A0A0E9RY76_ANGAN
MPLSKPRRFPNDLQFRSLRLHHTVQHCLLRERLLL